jgi:hypothetical protein
MFKIGKLNISYGNLAINIEDSAYDGNLAELVAVFFNSNVAADKTQAFEEPVVNDNSPSPELQSETICSTPGVANLVEEPAGNKVPPSVAWDQYKSTVLAPLLEKTLSEAKTKAAQKLAEPRVKELRKCLSIGLSDKFDEDFLEQMYLAKTRTFGNLVEKPLAKDCETIYVLKENTYLIEGKELSSYTVVDNVLSIPDKTCQYLDENGELGEAVYAMAQARKDIKDGKVALKKATEAENATLLRAKLASIEANPDYSPEEKRNRIRNVTAMYSITDFSKV